MITRRELLALIPAAMAMPAAQASEVPFERIDVHLHIQRSAPVFVAAMEKAGWRGLSICDCRAVGDEVFDLEKDLQGTLSLHRESKGRIAWAATFDPRPFERPDFSSRVIANLNEYFKQEAVGVKIWKTIGMSIQSKSGEYLMADDPVFFPIYEAIQKADRVLIAHLADPSGMWLPPRTDNPRTSPSWWNRYGHPGTPSKEDVLLARDRVIAKYPKLRVCGCHLGSNEDNLVALSKRLDTYPNFVVDAAARVGNLVSADREAVRQFMMKYQDRVAWGVDFNLANSPSDEAGWQSVNAAHERDWNFFASSGTVVYGGGRAPSREVQGLGLPESVLRKIYRDNAARWYPGIAG
jgi:hypothetical protein